MDRQRLSEQKVTPSSRISVIVQRGYGEAALELPHLFKNVHLQGRDYGVWGRGLWMIIYYFFCKRSQ